MTKTVHATQDRYHQGAGRDCPDCAQPVTMANPRGHHHPDLISAGLKVTGWGEGLLGYPPALELQQVAIKSPQIRPSIDDVGTLDMFEEFG